MSFGCRLPKCTSHDLIYVDLRKLMAMPIARRFVASGLPIAGRLAASGFVRLRERSERGRSFRLMGL